MERRRLDRGARWSWAFVLLLGLAFVVGACSSPPPPNPPPSGDDGPFNPVIAGSEVFVGSGLRVSTENAYGRSIARLVSAEVRSADAVLDVPAAGGGTGDPGDPGTASGITAGNPWGSALVVFDRCANGDCGLRSRLVLDNPNVLTDPGVSTTYSGTGVLTLAGDGGVIRGESSTTVEGAVVVDAVSGLATLSFSTAVWPDAAGVTGVRLDDVVVSGTLDGLGGSGEVVVDGVGVVTGANSWGLADGVAARVSANIGSARPVVAVRGFDASEAGSVDRLLGFTSTAPDAMRRWLRAPEFWVISAPDGGNSPLGAQPAGTQVRLVYVPGQLARTFTTSNWTFGQDVFSGLMVLDPADLPSGQFSGQVGANLLVTSAGAVLWNTWGPVRMNLSARQPAVAGDFSASVTWDEVAGCTPCGNVYLDAPDVWVGPVRVLDSTTTVDNESGSASFEVWSGGVMSGTFGPATVAGGDLGSVSGSGGSLLHVGVTGTISGHAVTASADIDLASPVADVTVDVTVDEGMRVEGGFNVDLSSSSWAVDFPGTFMLGAGAYPVSVAAQLSSNVFDVAFGVGEAVSVTDDITFVTMDVHAVGNVVSVVGDAQWQRTTPGLVTHLDGQFDGQADGVHFDVASDAVFRWANGDVALRDLRLAGVFDTGAHLDIGGTFEFPGNVLAFEGSMDADAAGWLLDLHEATGSSTEFTIGLTWDVAAGTLTGSGSLGRLAFGRVEVADSQFSLFADADSVDVTPVSAGRVLVDGGETLDAGVSGPVTYDEPSGMLHAAVIGQGTVLGKAPLAVSGTVDAHIVGNETEWVDLGVAATGEVQVGDRAEVRFESFDVTGRLQGQVSTLVMDASVNLMGVALPTVSGDATVSFTPGYQLESVGLDLGVPGAPGAGSLTLDFVGGLASLSVSGNVCVDNLDYGDFSLEGLCLTVTYVWPSTVVVTATFAHLRYRDQVDLTGSMGVTFDLLAPNRLIMSAQASGQIGQLQVTDIAVDMVWDIPSQTLTGNAAVGSVDYDFGRVKVIGGGVSFVGDPNGFNVSSTSAAHVLVDGGATLDAEVSGAVSWDTQTGMLHVDVTGQGTVLGRGELAVSGSVDAHVVDNQAEWVDLDVTASGVFPVGGRNEIRMTNFALQGRIQGLSATLNMAADLNVLGVEVSVSGDVVVTFTSGTHQIESLELHLAAPLGSGVQAGLDLWITGNLASLNLHGWLTADRLAWGDFVVEGLRLDLTFNGASVQLSAQAAHVRYQDTVDVGGQITLGWDVGSEIINISGDLHGRVGVVNFEGGTFVVHFEAILTVPTRHLWLNAHGDGRAVFGQGRNTVWFDDFHVWGDLALDANFHSSADLNVNGLVGFASEDLGAPIEEWMDGTLHATVAGSHLSLVLSVALSGTISATNVTLGIEADISQSPIEPTVTLHGEGLNFMLEGDFEFWITTLDLLFHYDSAHKPELDMTMSGGHVQVRRSNWAAVLDADVVSLHLYYSDDTHLRADWTTVLNATLTASGMEDLPVSFAFCGAGHVVLDTVSRAVTFDLTADTGVSVPLGGDAGVRFEDLHLAGSFESDGLDATYDATEVRIGPATGDPWVVGSGPSGSLASDAAGHEWDLTLDSTTVTGGDQLFTGQVYGSLHVGATTTGGLNFTGDVALGGVIQTVSISAAGIWTGSSLTVGGEVRTAGMNFAGQAAWARLAGNQHRLTSLARWDATSGSAGLDMDVILGGGTGLYGTMTAYGVAVWPGTVAVGTVAATFNGTVVTADLTVDIGPVTDVTVHATLDWDVDTLTVADGTFTIEAASTILGRPVGGSVTVGGNLVVSGSLLSVTLTADGHLGLLDSDSVLYFDGLNLSFDMAGGILANGAFGGTLYLGPSNWIDISGVFSQPLPGTWTISIATSTANGTTGSVDGYLATNSDGRFTGSLTANGVVFGPAHLDNLALTVTPSSLRVTALDAHLDQTVTTPPMSLQIRNVDIAWNESMMILSGSLSFDLGGPGWLPIACQAEVRARATLARVGTSTIQTTGDTFAGCVFGDYGNGFAGIQVKLKDLSGHYTTDSSGTVTDAALDMTGELRFGDLFHVSPAHFQAGISYDDSTQIITINFAGNYGTYTLTGGVALTSSGQLGNYNLTLTNSSGELTVGPFLNRGSARIATPITLTGSGNQFSLAAPSLTLEATKNGSTNVLITATGVTLTRQDDKLVLTGLTGGVQQTLANFGAVVVTTPTVHSLSAGIEPGAITLSINADFTATINNVQGAPATIAFTSTLEIVVNTNSANITIGADLQASLDWQPVGGPNVQGFARVAGTFNIDLTSLIVTVTSGELEISPDVAVPVAGGALPFLEGELGGGADNIAGTLDLNTGLFTLSGNVSALLHASWADLDAYLYADGTTTLTNSAVQVTGAQAELGLLGVLVGGIPNPSGPEVTDIWGRFPYGQDPLTAPWCGTKWTGGLTGPGCETAGLVTGTVEADLNHDGQSDGWPQDPAQRPVGTKVSLVSDPTISQFIEPTDGTFTLVGVPAGAQVIRVEPAPTWSTVGEATRPITVTANNSVEVTPPFLLMPFDHAGSPPYFVGAQGGILDLGHVSENVSWRPRQTTQFPIQVVDIDGDSVDVTLGSIYSPSFVSACGNGPVCLTLDNQGVIEFNPPVGWDGVVSFTLTASDGHWEEVSVLAMITVDPLECGSVDAPAYLSYTIDEDATLGDSFVLGDPCNSWYPTGRVVVPPQHGIASARMQMLLGFPTHNIEFAYMPQSDYNGTDYFVIESCNKSTEFDEGPPYSCALTTVDVTITPIDDPPRVAYRYEKFPPGSGHSYIPIEYQGVVNLPSFADAEHTYTLWAYDPEGVYSIEEGTIVMDEPNATSDRSPEDLGITRTDYAGYGDWDIIITPPPGSDWDGVGSFAMHLCDPELCNSPTARLYPIPAQDPATRTDTVITMAPGTTTRSMEWLTGMGGPSQWRHFDPETATLELLSLPGPGIDNFTVDSSGISVTSAPGYCTHNDDPYAPTARVAMNGVPALIEIYVNCTFDSYVGTTYLLPGETKTHAVAYTGGNMYGGYASVAEALRDNFVVKSANIRVCHPGGGISYGGTTFGDDQKATMNPNACGLPGTADFIYWEGLNCGWPTVCNYVGSVALAEALINNTPVVGPTWAAISMGGYNVRRLATSELAREVFGAIDAEDIFDLSVEIVDSSGAVSTTGDPGGMVTLTSPTGSGVGVTQLRFVDSRGAKTGVVNLITVVTPKLPPSPN